MSHKTTNLRNQIKIQAMKILIIEEEEIEAESSIDKLLKRNYYLEFKLQQMTEEYNAIKLDLLNYKNGLL